MLTFLIYSTNGQADPDYVIRAATIEIAVGIWRDDLKERRVFEEVEIGSRWVMASSPARVTCLGEAAFIDAGHP